jgi:hypothetical protein
MSRAVKLIERRLHLDENQAWSLASKMGAEWCDLILAADRADFARSATTTLAVKSDNAGRNHILTKGGAESAPIWHVAENYPVGRVSQFGTPQAARRFFDGL